MSFNVQMGIIHENKIAGWPSLYNLKKEENLLILNYRVFQKI